MIYTITHIESGRVYVGSSKAPKKRWTNHQWHLGRGTHHCLGLQAVWARDGAAAFVYAVVEECSAEDRFVREQAWMDNLGATLPWNGFNLAPIAGEFTHSDDGKRRVAEATRARKADHSTVMKALWADPEYRAKQIAARKKAAPRTAATMKALWADAGHRARMLDAFAEPEAKAKREVAAERGLAVANSRPLTEEQKARKIAALAILRADPEVRARQKANSAAALTPEFLLKRGAAIAAAKGTPEARAANGARTKEIWAKRKAELTPGQREEMRAKNRARMLASRASNPNWGKRGPAKRAAD